jgi:hypothetical protein
MYSRQKVLWAAMLLVPMVLCVSASAYVVTDDDVPEVTARVARVTYVSGDVQIRRSGNADWERVTVDLPVVEGDEIATGADARTEIQLDSFGRLRLDKNSFLRISALKDEGIALTLPQGTLSVRLMDFDKNKSYFEIDAPKTTVAIQKSGVYRIDAGAENDKQIRVAATESGEARIYSENSGFTLKNGRRATVNIAGDLAGEWDAAEAAKYMDDFDSWALDRDAAIAKRLNDAYYDKYYDRDIYGAEDLDDNGEWIHTTEYGYVWRPYQNAIGRYSDWSPYRYGEWRWVPPFGWTWVNDEPWGWATYHHGRWFYDNGYWYWSPYGYYRNRRSWWSPALVVITVYNDDFCWYPLPYRSAYYDCNWYFHHGDRHGRHDNDWSGRNPQTGAAPSPSPGRITGPDRMKGMPYYHVPVGGVVTVPGSSFGTGRGDIKKAPPEIAKGILQRNPGDENMIPRLPKIGDVSSRVGGRIKIEKPVVISADKTIATGAIERKGSSPLDDELRITRVLDKRLPVSNTPGDRRGSRMEKGGTGMRDTGAVGRPVTPPADSVPTKSIPRSRDTAGDQNPPNREEPRYEPPSKAVEPRQDPPVKGEPRYNPPSKSVEPRNDPPKREEPRYNPPSKSVEPRNDPPKQEQPRYEPPPRQEQPRKDPPPRQEQPKSEPPRSQPDSKPSPDTSRKKDG